MSKFKPIRGKKKGTAKSQGAIPCVVFLISAMVLLLLLLYLVMKSFSS